MTKEQRERVEKNAGGNAPLRLLVAKVTKKQQRKRLVYQQKPLTSHLIPATLKSASASLKPDSLSGILKNTRAKLTS